MDDLQAAMRTGLEAVLGTAVPSSVPLMSVGLDSIAAVEFADSVSDQLGLAFSAIALFDHPTLDSVASFLAGELEEDAREKEVCEMPDAGG